MPPEQDAQAAAIARGDILSESASTDMTGKAGDTTGASPTASAAPEKETETPSSQTQNSDQGSEATLTKGKTAEPAEKSAEPEEKPHMIPKGRFDQAVGKERTRAEAAEAELQKFRNRAAQQAQAANHHEAMKRQKELLKQHSSLLADGDLDKASDVMEQVLQLRDDMQTAKMERQADNARNSAKIEVQYDQTVTKLEAEYPEINPDAEAFDEGTVRNVQAMVAGLMQSQGLDPASALIQATDVLLKPAKEAKAASLREKPSEEAAEAGLRRKQAQVDKNLEAAQQQPPETAEVGKDHDAAGGSLDATAVASMSWEEFINVPDEELAKMRGDYIN